MPPKIIDPVSLPYRLGVGVVLFNAKGLVFTARRIDTKPDAWQFPQGGIDEGEDPVRAVFREMKEEIGVDDAVILEETKDWLTYDLPPHLLGKAWGGLYRGQRQKWYALSLTGDETMIDINTEHPEFDAWRWFPLEEIEAQIVPFKRALYHEIVEAFLPLSRKLRS